MGVLEFLWLYQTLIAGVLAVVAAAVTALVLWKGQRIQTRQFESEIEYRRSAVAETRARETIASLASLLPHLDALTRHAGIVELLLDSDDGKSNNKT